MNLRIVFIVLLVFFLVHIALGMDNDHEAGPSSRPGGSQQRSSQDGNTPPRFERSRTHSEGPAPSIMRSPSTPVRRGRRVERRNIPVGQKKRRRILDNLKRQLDDPGAVAASNHHLHQQCKHQNCHHLINGDRLLKMKMKFWTEKTEGRRTAFLTQFCKKRQDSGKTFSSCS